MPLALRGLDSNSSGRRPGALIGCAPQPSPPRPAPRRAQDYAACIWPQEVDGGQRPGSLAVAQWADELNERQPGWAELQAAAAAAAAARRDGGGGAAAAEAEAAGGAEVITLSHFLPHQELLPEKRWASRGGCAAGCAALRCAALGWALAAALRPRKARLLPRQPQPRPASS